MSSPGLLSGHLHEQKKSSLRCRLDSSAARARRSDATAGWSIWITGPVPVTMERFPSPFIQRYRSLPAAREDVADEPLGTDRPPDAGVDEQGGLESACSLD